MDEFYATVVEEAIAEINYASDNLTVELIADPSCIYQADDYDNLNCTVRGILKVHINVKPTDLVGLEATMLSSKYGFTQLYQGVDMYHPIDIHMNTLSSYPVSVNTIVPIGSAF